VNYGRGMCKTDSRSWYAAWVALCVPAWTVGCISGVTPPVGFVAHEGAGTLGPGATSLTLSAGGGMGACCGWVGGGAGGQGRVRHGVADSLEVGGSVLVAWFSDEDFEPVGGPVSVGGQGELKVALTDEVALLFGAGGGSTPLATFFVNGSTALIVGKKLPRVELYGQGRLAFSGPFGATARIPDEDPGTVEPAAYLIGSVGLLKDVSPRAALALEIGGGGIFTPPRSGGAGYVAVGIQIRLGDDP
jgi:hypothetical protein